MSRYWLPVASGLFVSAALHAQNMGDNFIELTVSDTVPVKLKSIAYDITPLDTELNEAAYDGTGDYEKYQREANERATKLNDRLKKDLTGAGYTLGEVPSYGDPYSISGYEEGVTGTGTRVLVKSETELKKLVAWLRQRGSVEGHIGEWNYDADPGVMEALMTNLFNKAKAQAERLASLGGRKLGKLLSAHDPQDREMTFKDFMRAIDDRGADENAMRELQLRHRQMVFRFALVD